MTRKPARSRKPQKAPLHDARADASAQCGGPGKAALSGLDRALTAWFAMPASIFLAWRKAGTAVGAQMIRAMPGLFDGVAAPKPDWATPNEVILTRPSLRLRAFGGIDAGAPVLLVPPHASHRATLVDLHPDQSLAATLGKTGIGRVLVADWRSAHPMIQDHTIDAYLLDLKAAVDAVGGRATLVGLCQGGWLAAIFAARFPDSAAALVLAGAAIDTHAGSSAISSATEMTPTEIFRQFVDAGGGIVSGEAVLKGLRHVYAAQDEMALMDELFGNTDPEQRSERSAAYARWFDSVIDLPGPWFLEIVQHLYKENQFHLGRFKALGRRVGPARIRCPLFVLAGKRDIVTPPPQALALLDQVSTDPSDIGSKVVDCSHLGLFIGHKSLRRTWPAIARWLRPRIARPTPIAGGRRPAPRRAPRRKG